MIIDRANIYVKSGMGGQGHVSSLMLSARKVIGGGGSGGRGGDVILEASQHLYDLNKFRERNQFIAANGDRGKENNRTGKSGQDVIVPVPIGTRIFDHDELVVDINQPKQKFVICRGGQGGQGNYKQIYSLPPEPGEEKELFLDFCVPNDVAVIGFANSGKTSLVNRISFSKFKVADYPFTTTYCAWARFSDKFTILDTPPLRRESLRPKAENRNWFLKHLLRTKIILLVNDAQQDLTKEFNALKQEITYYDKSLLSNKKLFYLINKIDTIKVDVKTKNTIKVSAWDGQGVDLLLKKIIKELSGVRYEKNSD